ncbi:MAG: hypothetical protein IKC59_06340 [Clostridia bacterium]|nr:hypothetical protein [Clostridia bacterium]
MSQKISAARRIISLTIAVVILLPMLFACKKGDEISSSVPTVTVDEEGEITFLLKLEAEELQAHAGQTAFLYELLPGEELYAINEKSSMMRANVSSKIKFTFPVIDENGADRRCNSYVLTFSDGTVYSAPVYVSGTQTLAKNTENFPHGNTVKGMNSVNEELSASLYSAHTLIPISASAMITGDTPMAWNGITVAVNGALLAQTDAQVKKAANADMQITLELAVEEDVSNSLAVALINLLLERYSAQERGVVTAIVLRQANPIDPEADDFWVSVQNMGYLMSMTNQSMLSRVQNGRVYLGADGRIDAIKLYAAEVAKASQKIIPLTAFGVALYPKPLTASLYGSELNTEARELLLSDLSNTVEALSDEIGRSTRFAVLGLKIPSADTELQAALYAYAYRASVLSKVDFLIYEAPLGEEYGFYGSNGENRPIADCFALADTADNVVGESFAERLLGKDWTSLKSVRAARVAIREIGNPGISDDVGKRYLDFSEEKRIDFVAVGSAAVPAVVRSELWQSDVLMTSVQNEAYGMASGFRCTLPDLEKLDGVHVLSANLLAQSTAAQTAEVTLTLVGTASDGRKISLTSTVSLSCNTWQAVSFHIKSFTAQLDTEQPCTMSLTVKPVGEGATQESASHALWLHSVNLRRAAADLSGLLLIGLIVGGFGIGVSAVLICTLGKKRAIRKKADGKRSNRRERG